MSLNQPVLFLGRRIFFIFVACAMQSRPLAQVSLICLTQFVVIVYLAGWKPYDNPMDNKLELFNEVCATALLSLILGYSNPNINGPT